MSQLLNACSTKIIKSKSLIKVVYVFLGCDKKLYISYIFIGNRNSNLLVDDSVVDVDELIEEDGGVLEGDDEIVTNVVSPVGRQLSYIEEQQLRREELRNLMPVRREGNVNVYETSFGIVMKPVESHRQRELLNSTDKRSWTGTKQNLKFKNLLYHYFRISYDFRQ